MADQFENSSPDLASAWDERKRRFQQGQTSAPGTVAPSTGSGAPIPGIEGAVEAPTKGGTPGYSADFAIGVKGAVSSTLNQLYGVLKSSPEAKAQDLVSWASKKLREHFPQIPEAKASDFYGDIVNRAVQGTAVTDEDMKLAHPDVYGAVARATGQMAVDLPKFHLTGGLLRAGGLGKLSAPLMFAGLDVAGEQGKDLTTKVKAGAHGALLGTAYELLGFLALPSRVVGMGGIGVADALATGAPLHEVIAAGLVGGGLGVLGGRGGTPLKEVPGKLKEKAGSIKQPVAGDLAPEPGGEATPGKPAEGATGASLEDAGGIPGTERLSTSPEQAMKDAATAKFLEGLEAERDRISAETEQKARGWDKERAEQAALSGVEEIPWNEGQLGAEASERGVWYMGLLENRAPLYRDPWTGATFVRGPGETVDSALWKAREVAGKLQESMERAGITDQAPEELGMREIPAPPKPPDRTLSSPVSPEKGTTAPIPLQELTAASRSVKRTIPGAKVSLRNDPVRVSTPTGEVELADRVEVILPNGRKVYVLPGQDILIDRGSFQRQMGRDPLPGEYIEGEFTHVRLNREGIIRLSKEGWGQGTVDHETFHAVMALALTPKEHAAVIRDNFNAILEENKPAARELLAKLEDGDVLTAKEWGVLAPAEEAGANFQERYSTWRRKFEAEFPTIAKVRWMGKRLAEMIETPTAQNIAERVASGRAWGKEEGVFADRATAEKRGKEMNLAAKAQEKKYIADIGEIAKEVGGTIDEAGLPFAVKSAERMADKLQAKGEVTDMLRGTLVVDDPAKFEQILAKLEQRGYVVRESENLYEGEGKAGGYRHMAAKLVTKGGDKLIRELQVLTPAMATAKAAVGHDFYDVIRAIDESRQRGILLPRDAERVSAVLKLTSNELYTSVLAMDKSFVEAAATSGLSPKDAKAKISSADSFRPKESISSLSDRLSAFADPASADWRMEFRRALGFDTAERLFRLIDISSGALDIGTIPVPYEQFKVSPEAVFSPGEISRATMSDRAVSYKVASRDEVARANASSRASGAIGQNAVVPRVVRDMVQRGIEILDFGAGKKAIHAESLKADGHKVTAYEFGENVVDGLHDRAALTRQYEVVYGSNVLNVQDSRGMLDATIQQMARATKPEGRLVVNLPASPRYGAFDGLSPKEGADMVRNRLSRFFGRVEKFSGSDSTPVLIASEPGVAEARAADYLKEKNKLTPGGFDTLLWDSSGPRYSVATFGKWKDRYVAEARALGVSERDIKRIEAQISDVASVLAAKPGLLKEATEDSPIKSNADFQFTVDLDTNCPRRTYFGATVSETERRLNRPLSQDERLGVAKLMQERGHTFPCSFCYVETGRAVYANDFSKKATELGIPADIAIRGANDAEFRKAFEKTDPGMAAKLEKARAYAQASSQANQPKETSAYTNQVLDWSKERIYGLNRRAGLRFFSNTDFKPEHVLDLMQVVGDMSARGMAGHAYTKQEDFVNIFGNTGLKINMSLRAKGDVYDPATGKGNISEDAAEGMRWQFAKEAVAAYDHVGAIMVVANDAQLNWALDQPWIGQIIPLHVANMKQSVRDELGYKNYSGEQHERWIDGKTNRGKDKPELIAKDFIVERGDGTTTFDKRGYLERVKELGLKPKFPRFVDHPGYGKLIADFARWDSKQEPVTTAWDVNLAKEKVTAWQEAGGTPEAPKLDVVEDFVRWDQGPRKLNTIMDAEMYTNASYKVARKDVGSQPELFDIMKKEYGTTDDIQKAWFIGSDGTKIHVPGGVGFDEAIRTGKYDEYEHHMSGANRTFNLAREQGIKVKATEEWENDGYSTLDDYMALSGAIRHWYAKGKNPSQGVNAAAPISTDQKYAILESFKKEAPKEFYIEYDKAGISIYVSQATPSKVTRAINEFNAAMFVGKPFTKQHVDPFFNEGGASYKVANTKAVEWAKDSAVKDERGNPKMLFHATDKANFDTFGKTQDIGFHFGTSEQANELGAQRSISDARDVFRGKGTGEEIFFEGEKEQFAQYVAEKASGWRTLPVYLNLKKPVRLTDLFDWRPASILRELESRQEFSQDMTNPLRAKWRKELGERWDMKSTSGQYADVRSLLAKKGYDGIVYRNDGEILDTKIQDREDSYIAFKPEQIKSVFNTEFDPTDPRFKVGRRIKSAVSLKPANEEEIRAFTSADPKDLMIDGKQVGINFDKVNTEDDVKRVMASVIKLNENWDQRLGGHKTLEELAGDARKLGLTPEELIDVKTGQALNHSELFAAKQITLASAKVLFELNKEYQSTGSEAAKLALSKQIAMHTVFQEQFGRGRREASWALNVLRNEADGEMRWLKGLENAMARMGPGVDVDKMSRLLATMETPEQMARLVAKAERATTSDVLLEAWINGLLSGPQTHVANIMSNFISMTMGVAERGVARLNPLKKAGPSGENVVPGEAAAMISGFVGGWQDALRAAWKVVQTGESIYSGEKIDLRKKQAIKADTFGVANDTTLGRSINMLGEIVRTPGKALFAADEFFKLVNYRMEVNAQATRQAYLEGLTGSALKARVNEILMDPPEVVREAALDWGRYMTFTNELGPMGQSALRFARSHPAMRLVVPFMQTPTNIAKFTFERAPGLNLLSKGFREDVLAGGARRDLAFAKLAMGAVTLAAVTGLAASGVITGGGPSDENLKKIMKGNGWQPYSVKIGDEYVSFNRLDPMGALFGFAADLHDILGNVDDLTFGKAVMGSVLAISQAMISKTYLTGIAGAMDALSEPEKKAATAFNRLAASVVPTFMAQTNRAVFDQNVREAHGLLDMIKAKIPGMSTELPPRRNLFGEPIYYEGGLGPDLVSPLYTMKDKADPVAEEMIANQISIAMPAKVIWGKKPAGDMELRNPSTKDGVQLEPAEYDRLVALAGNELKVNGKGMHDYLEDLIRTPEYKALTDGPDGAKAMVIRQAVNRYREAARAKLFEEFPELGGAVEEKLRSRAEALVGGAIQ